MSSTPSKVDENQWLCSLQGIPEATTFRPTEEEFADPLKYIDSIRTQVSAIFGARPFFQFKRVMELQRAAVLRPWDCAGVGCFHPR